MSDWSPSVKVTETTPLGSEMSAAIDNGSPATNTVPAAGDVTVTVGGSRSTGVTVEPGSTVQTPTSSASKSSGGRPRSR